MKKKILILLPAIACLAFVSLFFLTKGEDDHILFNRADFKQSISLDHPEEIEIEELLDPVAFHLMHDSILVVQNQLHCDYLIELYSLNTRRIVAQLASKGNGPGEVQSCIGYVSSNADPSFMFKDERAATFYEIHLESTLRDKRLHVLSKFPYDPNIRQGSGIYRIDDERYIGYNMWYLDDPAYNNNVEALSLYPITREAPAPYDLSDYSYFVAPVNDAHIYVNASDKEIWLLDGHKDKITIYDDSLRIRRTLVGPDHYEPTYNSQQANIPMPFINFPEDKYYGAYLGYTVTDRHIYTIYQGINGGKYDMENLPPVEVFKFDKKGNPITRYQLDRYVYTISVDSREKYMYATSRYSAGESATLVKYQLK